jgi:hypothetical protein
MLFSVHAIVVLSLAASASTGPVERSETRVEIRGPVAHVTVDRVVSSRSLVSQPNRDFSIFDITIPQEARILSLKVTEPTSPIRTPKGNVAATVVVPTRQLVVDPSILAPLAKVPFDPSATLRLAFDNAGPALFWAITYSYTLPLTCRDGWWHLELPGAVDLAPIPGNFDLTLTMPSPLRLREVRIAGKPWLARGQSFHGQTELPGQLAVPLAFQLRPNSNTISAGWSMVAETEDSDLPSILAVCRAPPASNASPPTVVVAVIDTSRSVGVTGLSLQREFAKSFLSALPGSTRFNVISFDSEVHRLFPFARLATKEAFGLLDQHLIPERLANGTSLPLALGTAAKEVEQEVRADALSNPWVLLISDGSLPQSTTTRQTQAAATGRVLNLPIASVVLRPENEDRSSEPALRILRNLAASGGGGFREVTPPALSDQARSLANGLLAGGDWFDVRREGALIAPALAPGTGTVISLAGDGKPVRTPRSIGFRQRGILGSIPVRKISLPATWTRGGAVVSPKAASQIKLPSGRSVIVTALSMPPTEDVARGELERSVLRNALSLSYLPRARACYLNRPASNARLRDLQGKVRLSLELERGEMLSSKVISTTLDNPDIEKCLLEATFALNIPRPLLRDAPVEAVLNLVFRPATTDSSNRGAADASLLDQELEVLLGPRVVVDTPEDLGAIPGN